MANVLNQSVINPEISGAAPRPQVRSSVPADKGQSRLIPLTQGKFAIVDIEDYEWLSKYKWYAVKTNAGWRARRKYRINGRQITVQMHRFIINPPKTKLADHRNRNTLDNRRFNLRICTSAQNSQNSRSRRKSSSRYKGVSKLKDSGKWRVSISTNGLYYYIGRYICEIDAAKAYDKKAIELFGEFAYLNFPLIQSELPGASFIVR